MLDDLALILGPRRALKTAAAPKDVGVKVRFRNDSEMARDVGISTTTVGVVSGFYDHEARSGPS